MARRADFHRRRRNVHVRQLFELVVHAGQLFLDVFGRAARRDIQKHAAVRAAAAFANLSANGAGHHVARQQLRWPPGGRPLVGNRRRDPAVRFLLSFRELTLKHVRNVTEHEPLALAVHQHATFAADAFGDQRAAHAGRPDHAGGMELHEFHVDQVGTGPHRHGMAVGRVLPRVRRDLPATADAAGGQHHRFRA